MRVRITQGETSREVIIPAGFAEAAAGESTPANRRWRALTWEEVKPEIHALRKPPERATRHEGEDADAARENSASQEQA